jgi:RNA-directed DNA polymerase
VLDLWVSQWRKKQARGEVVVVRFADDFVVGFEHREDGERFLSKGKAGSFWVGTACPKDALD